MRRCLPAFLRSGCFLLILASCTKPAPPPVEQQALEVTVAKPAYLPVTEYSDMTGVLDSPNTVELRPRVSGYIQDVQFKDGQQVKEGDVLFQIDPTTYQADVRAAEAEIASRNAKVQLAVANEARFREALKSKAVSQMEYDVTAAEKAVAEADLLKAKAQLNIAQQNLEWTKVTAPIAGIVDRAYLTKGNVASGGMTQGTVLTTIVSVDPMYGYIDLDDQTVLYFQRLYAQNRQNGKTVDQEPITAELQLQGEEGYPHKGVMDFVSNRINPSTGSLQIRGTFPNPDRLLLAGRFIRVRIPLGAPSDSILVPDAAILTEQSQKLVYIVTAENKVEARPVELGPRARGLRVIASGLKPDDRVIIRGLQRVRPGVTVTPLDGAITPEQAPGTPQPTPPLPVEKKPSE